MVISRIIGGLGNQMFQYATGKSLANKLKTNLKLDIEPFKEYKLRIFELDCFKLEYDLATSDDIKKFKLYNSFPLRRLNFKNRANLFKLIRGKNYFKEPHSEVTEDFFKLSGDVYLDGYWNSKKYINSVSSQLMKDFQFKNKPHKSVKPFIENIRKNMSISLHVRRGDYASVPKTNRVHGLCGVDYYNKAINKMISKLKSPVFFIFSDDKKWARENIKSNHEMIYINHEGENYEDMRLMSLCKHNIVANSTFSWWGSWLNANSNKIVIAPKKWFQVDDMNDKDVCPDEWIKI